MKFIRCMGKVINSLEISQGIMSDIEEIRRQQTNDKNIQDVKKKDIKNEYGIVKNGVYVKRNAKGVLRLFISKELIGTTLQVSHETSGYAGSYKLYHFVIISSSCELCQRVKYLNYKMEGAYQQTKATEPNEFVSVDFYGPFPSSTGGVSYIFVVQDLFSN